MPKVHAEPQPKWAEINPFEQLLITSAMEENQPIDELIETTKKYWNIKLLLTGVKNKPILNVLLKKTVVVFGDIIQKGESLIYSGFFMPSIYGGGVLGNFMFAVFLFARFANPIHSHRLNSLATISGGFLTQKGDY